MYDRGRTSSAEGDANVSAKANATISPTTVMIARWGAALVFATALVVGWMTATNGWSMVAVNTVLAAAVIAAFIAIALVATRCIQVRINRATKRYADIAEQAAETAVEDIILSVSNNHTAMKKAMAKMETRLIEELQHTRQAHYATLAEAKTQPALKSV